MRSSSFWRPQRRRNCHHTAFFLRLTTICLKNRCELRLNSSPERSILIEFIFFFYFIYIKMRGDICEDTTPLTKKFLNYDSQKESVNIYSPAKVLGFAEILVKQSYFNTNLTISSSFERSPDHF
nr:MAG TPA: hypothetical protein [Caudoviricetes sp.]